jgi:hypothetical protein
MEHIELNGDEVLSDLPIVCPRPFWMRAPTGSSPSYPPTMTPRASYSSRSLIR